MEEIWKEYRSYYRNGRERSYVEVSSFGNVKVHLWNGVEYQNYEPVILKKHRCVCTRSCQIFRLVYTVFVGPVPKGYCIHHKDHNPLNDRLDNLELMLMGDHTGHHRTGKHHYNNGEIEVFAFECPAGFVPGCLNAAWNKNLTKEIDERVAKYASTLSEKMILYWKNKEKRNVSS